LTYTESRVVSAFNGKRSGFVNAKAGKPWRKALTLTRYLLAGLLISGAIATAASAQSQPVLPAAAPPATIVAIGPPTGQTTTTAAGNQTLATAPPPPPNTYPTTLTSAEEASARSIIGSVSGAKSVLTTRGLAKIPTTGVRLQPLANADGTYGAYLDVTLPTAYSGLLTLPLPNYSALDPTTHLPTAAPRSLRYQNLRILRFIVDLHNSALVAMDPYATDGVSAP
jgi:hypothetical protein